VRTLVVQSHRPDRITGWISRCVESVRAWAAARGYHHELLGDELLALAPAWVAGKVQRAGDPLPSTDVARLVLLQQRLAAGWDRVVWVDADVVVFAEACISVEVGDELAVSSEVWVTGGAGGALRTLRLLNNSVVAATQPGATLGCLLRRTLDVARASSALHSRTLGPDLLTSLARERPLSLVRGFSLLSHHVVRDIAAGGGPALDRFRTESSEPIGAVNLCASMADDAVWPAATDRLLSTGTPL
jgi:hypothetical protein